jgi:hypothetical protein
VLKRGYRNYWWYNQGSPYGGYSHYTTCMLTTGRRQRGHLHRRPGNRAGRQQRGIPHVQWPIGGLHRRHYLHTLSSVNYLAAGSCNFNNAGVTIWPLDQIVADTQFYVRDSVIDYIAAQPGPIAPAVEGRVVFPTP